MVDGKKAADAAGALARNSIGVAEVEAPGEGLSTGERGGFCGSCGEHGDGVPAVVEPAVAAFKGRVRRAAALPNVAGDASALPVEDVFQPNERGADCECRWSGFHLNQAVFRIPEISQATLLGQVSIPVVLRSESLDRIPKVPGEGRTTRVALDLEALPNRRGGVLDGGSIQRAGEDLAGAGGRRAIDEDVPPGRRAADGGAAGGGFDGGV